LLFVSGNTFHEKKLIINSDLLKPKFHEINDPGIVLGLFRIDEE
jgi:hypothetical protein